VASFKLKKTKTFPFGESAVYIFFLVTLPIEILNAEENNDFPWEMFLPAITSTSYCSPRNPSKCDNIIECYYNNGYWYNKKCNGAPTTSKILNYLIVDGKIVKYKANDYISYKGNISGNFLFNSGNYQCSSRPVNLQGTGRVNFTTSPIIDQKIPPLIRQTITLNISSVNSSSISDFSQNNEGAVTLYYDPVGYWHNYPNGIIHTASPLKTGLSWSFDYYSYQAKSTEDYYYIYNPDGSIKAIVINTTLYKHIGNYTVKSKEYIDLDIGKLESYKIQVYYSKTPYIQYIGYDDTSIESGYIWYYPKIGIIKADLTISSYMDYQCFGSYNLKYEMTGSNLLKNNLPRD
jgi:hypothetical protein